MAAPVDSPTRPFEDLKTSTMTVMIYTNLVFDMQYFFYNVPITKIDPPLTKKHKNVDKRNIDAPYGAIVHVQKTTEFRGVDIRRKQKHWCTICCPTKLENDREVEDITVTEYSEADPALGNGDVSKIMYACSKCQRSYHPGEVKKINHFLNQLTIVLSVGKQPLLNIMMFRDNLKLAGCKNLEDAVEAMIVLWEDYLVKCPEAWTLQDGETTPKFVFEVVMRNVDFKLGFPIDREELNAIMNDPRHRDHVYMSQYESSGQTNVNIKMYSSKPADFKYDCLVAPLGGKPYFVYLDSIPYKSPKKVAKDERVQKFVTFIVFSSSEIILSGRYDANMKVMYEYFLDVVSAHRSEIEERKKTPSLRSGLAALMAD